MLREATALPRLHVEKVLEAATRAPSGDNLQPWRFRVEGSSIHVLRDPSRDRSAYNLLARARPDLIAIGACIENAALEAGRLGYSVAATPFPSPEEPLLCATLDLEPGDEAPDPLAASIDERRTNRHGFSSEEIPAALRARLLELVGSDADRVHIRGSGAVERLAATLADADRIVFEDERFHAGLFGAIRWEKGARDGLAVETLGLSRLEARGFRRLGSFRLVRFLRRLGLVRALAVRGERQIRASGAIACVTAPSLDERDFLAAGRLVERFWLACTAVGLSVQPLFGRVCLALCSAFGTPLRAGSEEALARVAAELGVAPGEAPAMIFRVGFGPAAAPSERRPADVGGPA